MLSNAGSSRMGIVPGFVAHQPWRLLVPLFVLIAFGAAVLHSAAGGSMSPYASSHLIRFGAVLVMALVMTRFNREFVGMAAFPIYGITLLLLMLVEAIGGMGGGSQRWLNLGVIVLQPSELMKPCLLYTSPSPRD